jgi:hypothetical protein
MSPPGFIIKNHKVALYTYIRVKFCTKHELFFCEKYFIIVGDKKVVIPC